jgi:hypothetical protein
MKMLLLGVLLGVMVPQIVNGAPEQRWTLILDGVFRNQTKPMYIYASERNGKWITAVGSSRDPARDGGKTYNRSWYYGDLSGAPIVEGKMQGRVVMNMTPDLWVPRDHRSYTIEIAFDAMVEDGKMKGAYEILTVNSKDETAQNFPKQGILQATSKLKEQPPLPEPFTLTCNMQGALVGGPPKFGDRCMILYLGMEKGKLVSTAHATMDKKFNAVDRKGFTVEGNTVTAEKYRFAANVAVPAETLDTEPCTYVFDIDGHIYDEHLVGSYDLTVKIEGKPDVTVKGSFDGKVQEGVTRYETRADPRPWFAAVKGFESPAPGEHPRLLFRKSDLPALREKMKTPEGMAILKRLRYLLNGSDGESMTTVFSDATHAYMGGGYRNTVLDKPGAFTIGHAAGYGLLYQLTGDKKYAEFGRKCFEASLAGKRDRDDRYSFIGPGGPLRAGPSLGWHALGFDLCYDGWDKATREKIGRAIAEYTGKSSTGKEKKAGDIETLTLGTMPPASNHFGMQVGGASLALLAVTGEPWVEQSRIDRLLKIAQKNTIRNLRDGFGDGGFFKEGDGTGSMSSHIVFTTALQAWRTAMGEDFCAVERPNARMIGLKWIYQTVVRSGKPDFWPIRGSYGGNVWGRGGISGAGYFAHTLGTLHDDERAAMKWYYDEFLKDADASRGAYDTVSPYPHVAVTSFVNWPTGIKVRNPADVLPRCYRDSDAHFYLWRNRWKDNNDTVITVLLTRTQGYMASKADNTFRINTMGKHSSWGIAKEGIPKHWSHSPKGTASSLTMSDGTAVAVDFSGASGEDVMLVTTGKAEGQTVKLGKHKITCYFPTTTTPPKVSKAGEAVTVGKQRITLADGNLVLAANGDADRR